MAEKKLSFELKNDLSELELLEEKLDGFCRQFCVTKKCYCEINLALEELFINIISYGFNDDDEHQIKFTISQQDNQVTMHIEDDGIPFNPADMDTPNIEGAVEERPVGGLGIHLIKNVMDHVDYKRRDNKNILTLTKQL
jgi:anti-sigma regulatory factor (Ser/Thr protein kinase)